MSKFLLAFVVLAVLLAGCAPATQEEPVAGQVTLFFTNGLSTPACLLHITSSSAEIDVVVASMDDPLPAGETRPVREALVGETVDIFFEDCDGNFSEVVEGLEIGPESLNYHFGVVPD